MSTALLAPVLALVGWSLAMWLWMYATRLPAMTKAGIAPDDARHTRSLAARLPSKAQAPADNYNHLMEQPTLFYATCLAGAVAGVAGAALWFAWGYVALRVVHSLVQATAGKVAVRFALFTASTLALAALAVTVALVL